MSAHDYLGPERELDVMRYERLLKLARLSDTGVSELFHVSTSTAWGWKTGRSRIPAAVLIVLEQRLHLNLHGLWNGWAIEGGKLIAPSGRAITPAELLDLIALRESQHATTALLDRVKQTANRGTP